MIVDNETGESGVLIAKYELRWRSSDGVRCFNGNKRGHFASDCRLKVKNDKSSSYPSPPADRDFATPPCVTDSQRNMCSTIPRER